MNRTDDDIFMRRCIELASKAEGSTFPNPLVGSVIVRNNIIIGEGYHLRAGMPHAEVNAINSVADSSWLKEATLYVNLEPCSHFGKTPPCADLIIERGIPKIVIGATDTSENVSGRGISRLKTAGCEVVTGVMEKECRWLNRRFFKFNEEKRPYIILKWAETADGYIDILRLEGSGLNPAWISGKPERVLVHKWRSEEQAILVGGGTIRADNPRLNIREWKGENPLKLVLTASGNLGKNFSALEGGRIAVFTLSDINIPGASMVKLRNDMPACRQIAGYLYQAGIESLFIEGGEKTLNHFITNELWDEARIFKGHQYFGEGVKAPLIRGKEISKEVFSGSTLYLYANEPGVFV
jgi:diaminohydroxyphosphoribosylaminopyrimidine deaminase / 5-amino-6-(5-phosphoribosylamino)uracil reductase